jgi:hypothetical protein
MGKKYKQYYNRTSKRTTYIFLHALEGYTENTPIHFEFENGIIPVY